MSLPLLLLSGAGMPAWVWDDVRRLLPDGVDSAVVEPLRDPGASLADIAAAAAAQAPWPRYGLVAHSVGGVVACRLLQDDGERVAALLGVAAVVPAPGRSFTASLPLPARAVLPLLLRVAGTTPPERSLRAMAAGLPEQVVDRLVRDHRPEPRRLFVDRVGERPLPPVRAYLRTTADREVPAAVQERSAQQLGATTVRSVATGHLPMLQDPAAVAAAVAELAV